MKRGYCLRILLCSAAMAALLTIQAPADRPVASSSDSTIAAGVHVEGIDLSGMTPEEARQALRTKAD